MVLIHYNEDKLLLKVVLWDNSNYDSFKKNVSVRSNIMSIITSSASCEGPSVEVSLHCRRTRERNVSWDRTLPMPVADGIIPAKVSLWGVVSAPSQ